MESSSIKSKEFVKKMQSSSNGFLNLIINILSIPIMVFIIVKMAENGYEAIAGIVGTIYGVIWVFHVTGFVVVQPNKSIVLTFFGKYSGTLRQNGFFWLNPFYVRKKLSLRARNFDGEPIKVNDKNGNPIMIGMVLVWNINDTYKATFDIDAESKGLDVFVRVQSDAALRKVAGMYAYDHIDKKTDELTLRSGGEEINEHLENELRERLAIAGIEIVEARINYLAYAAEIASVMLRRQQAEAIISAREKIVEGAVSMVDLALKKLSEERIVDLDEDKKAAMVSNLLVVLCADDAASPVINTGSLYQ